MGDQRPEVIRAGKMRGTSTGSVIFAFPAAISSNLFQVASRLTSTSCSIDSSSRNFCKHSSKSSESKSYKIFRTLRVKLWTAWFQWFRVFLSSAGNTIGKIILQLCLIKFSMWSLFHRNSALSATWKGVQKRKGNQRQYRPTELAIKLKTAREKKTVATFLDKDLSGTRNKYKNKEDLSTWNA